MIAITGGSGFIGSRVARALAAEGHQVVVWDLRPPEDGLPWRRVDVLDAAQVVEVAEDVEVVCHLVGPIAEVMAVDPETSRNLQINGTLNVLKACRERGVRKILFASSFYVYKGADPQKTVDESARLEPSAAGPFGGAKIMAERLVTKWASNGKLDHAILRIGSAYGSGRCTNLVKDLLQSGFARRPFVIWGKGQRRNQYTFVDDVAAGFLRALEGHGAYNLVSPEVHTTRELADIVRRRYGFEILFDETKRESPGFPYISPQRAMKELDWRPHRLESVLDSVAAELRDNGRG